MSNSKTSDSSAGLFALQKERQYVRQIIANIHNAVTNDFARLNVERKNVMRKKINFLQEKVRSLDLYAFHHRQRGREFTGKVDKNEVYEDHIILNLSKLTSEASGDSTPINNPICNNITIDQRVVYVCACVRK